ncbi:MAG: alanine--tRNA ligase [Pseudomonadota bacterium]
MLTSKQIREKFLKFWTESPRNCGVVPNLSLVPNVDSTLLFVNSGMFPLVPYLGGQPHPLGKRLCNFQRCLRTNYEDMLEIGDNRHTLMFEMIGDWSLGDFTKEQQIPWIMELWVKVYGMDPNRLYVSVFAGDETAPRDDLAIETWKRVFRDYGVEAEFSEDVHAVPPTVEQSKGWKYHIFPYNKKKNWWQRAEAPGELGGPTSEMFYDLGIVEREQDRYHINDDSGRFIEIGNNVFMEYRLTPEMTWEPLDQKNIDFGGGFERVCMIVQNKTDIFESDIYSPIIDHLVRISGRSYKTNGVENSDTAAFRVIADHGRAATFILADGISPSNKDQGYILRRFIRRLVRFGRKLGLEREFTQEVASCVIEVMSHAYPHLEENRALILRKIHDEEVAFNQTLSKGLKELNKIQAQLTPGETISGEQAFFIYETYGFPLELTLDELKISDEHAKKVSQEFAEAEKRHRELSRAGAEAKFKGGLADQSRETTKLHTAHHLLLAALQKLVDPGIKQKGSNITAERMRMDFNIDRKLSPEEVAKVESLVNDQIDLNLPVIRVEMPREEAEAIGAQMEFGAKYPDLVSVYFVGDQKSWFSAEFCGGPHVSSTSELAEGGKRFKIQKQENVGAGLKRIKAALV